MGLHRHDRVLMLLVAATLSGCGARSELRGPILQDAGPGDAVDAVQPRDVTTDAIAPDAPPPCQQLAIAAGPVTALTHSTGSFAMARVVPRAGGFDLFAFDGDGHILGRRMTVSGSPATLVFSDPTILGEMVFNQAEGGAHGETLAMGYVSGGQILQLWTGAYVSSARLQLSLPSPSLFCAGVVWAGDRWISGWSDGDESTSWVVEHSADGMPLAPPRMAGVDLGIAWPSLVAYGHGAAWYGPDQLQTSLSVVFARQGRADIRQVLPAATRPQPVRLSAWPSDSSAVAVVWDDRARAVHLLVIREDGTIPVDRIVIGATSIPRGVEIAPFRDGVVLEVCDTPSSGDGHLTIHQFGADGVERGLAVSVPGDCRGYFSDGSIAASDDGIAAAWHSHRPGSLDANDVSAAVLRCVQ